jgi:acyl-coenzyme A synthetase/AMP-(fatty) acid ligase
VAECAVIGIPDDAYGNRIAAYARLIESEAASDDVAADELAAKILADVGERLAPYKVPKSLTFVDEVPKNAVGKIMRRALIED